MYEVAWSEGALADLGRIWDALPFLHPHLLVARAVVDHHLTADPYRLSEGRQTDSIRVMFAYPLGVLFTVDDEAKKVVVATAWTFRLSR